ncbi:hypothetical protein [Parabacteroides leei]|uniref:hypothetical protein n=1 Tax=Parabacteroides leei TaxID=2939491 RepID=UPI00189B3B37|nr:hypothetical protein [uncultured Parabacteroides sp.]
MSNTMLVVKVSIDNGFQKKKSHLICRFCIFLALPDPSAPTTSDLIAISWDFIQISWDFICIYLGLHRD